MQTGSRVQERAPQQPPAGLFVRQSSGLVREVSTSDTVFYNISQIGLAFVIFTILAWGLYPGASIEMATFIAMIGTLAVGVTYALFSTAYPRSGGEYVFLSRVIHPLVGFVVSFSQAFWEAFYIGLNGAFLSLYGLSPLFAALGFQTNSKALTDVGTWFAGKWGVFITGSVIILVFTFALTRATRTFFRFQRITLSIALASLAFTILILFLGAVGVFDFHQHFDNGAGAGAYAKVISSAQHAGTDVSPAFDFGQTLNFMVWPAFSILFAVLSVSFGGEIRNIKRTQMVGIPFSIALATLLLILYPFLLRQAVGSDFLRATSTGTFPDGLPNFANTVSYLIPDSVPLTILMSIWTVVLIPFGAATAMLYASRAVLAWGVDGLAPSQVSKVDARHHAPVNAVIVVAVVGEVILALYAFTHLFVALSGLLGFAIAFCAVTLAGIAFPWLKREVFRGSPAAIRLGGIPVMVLTGIVGSAFLLFIIYRTLVDDAQGANTTTSIRTAVGVLVVGAVWFYVARALQRSKGTNIDQRFSEIPIE
jgi:amino acid transporter